MAVKIYLFILIVEVTSPYIGRNATISTETTRRR
jgi:hypothetical protein